MGVDRVNQKARFGFCWSRQVGWQKFKLKWGEEEGEEGRRKGPAVLASTSAVSQSMGEGNREGASRGESCHVGLVGRRQNFVHLTSV